MLIALCACLFSLAGLTATMVIAVTLRAFGPDVQQLRQQRFARWPDRYVEWRIVDRLVTGGVTAGGSPANGFRPHPAAAAARRLESLPERLAA